MKKAICFLLGPFLILVASAGHINAQTFTFNVKHNHFWGDCNGKLIINGDGIEYLAEESKHIRKWSYSDLKQIEIASRNELALGTYQGVMYRLGADEKFEFKLQNGEVTLQIYQLLLSRVSRPLVSRVPFSSGAYAFSLPVKHRHVLGGCHGVLKAGQNQLVYETSDSKDSRVWFYKDVESIGLMNDYSFRLTTMLETYTFDLKVALSSQQYQFLWARVYQLDNPYSTK